LKAGRKSIVFGEGDPGARLVFVGEGPGFEEDKQGRPFVGKAGQLLTKIIAAIGLDREQVYICNIIKCRPPGNRNPDTDEIESCAPFVRRQLQAIAPEFVCTLGTFATQTLLQTDRPISRLRGKFHDVMGMRIIPTYHPAYLLRNPEKKREVWEDMKLLMQAMGMPLPDKQNRKT
jgi:DNA polymerase